MTNNEIDKLLVYVMLNHPYFTTPLFKRKVSITHGIDTAATDGKNIYVNEHYLASLKFKLRVSLLFHEILHIHLFHPMRCGDRDIHIWNIACDYQVNSILLENGYEIGKDWLYDDRFRKMEPEEIYELIKNDSNKKPIGIFEIMGEEEKAQIVLEVESSYTAAKAAGKLPGFEDIVLKISESSKTNWRKELNQFMSSVSKRRYNFMKPSKRYTNFPKREKTKEINNIYVGIDCSGSTDEKMRHQFFSECLKIRSVSTRLIAMPFDTKVHGVYEIKNRQDYLHTKGNGGTDFTCVFEKINEQKSRPNALIIMTDGFCCSFPQKPEYPVLWLIKNNYSFNAPFGKIIHV